MRLDLTYEFGQDPELLHEDQTFDYEYRHREMVYLRQGNMSDWEYVRHFKNIRRGLSMPWNDAESMDCFIKGCKNDNVRVMMMRIRDKGGLGLEGRMGLLAEFLRLSKFKR